MMSGAATGAPPMTKRTLTPFNEVGNTEGVPDGAPKLRTPKVD
jgi:hypothetical protein